MLGCFHPIKQSLQMAIFNQTKINQMNTKLPITKYTYDKLYSLLSNKEKKITGIDDFLHDAIIYTLNNLSYAIKKFEEIKYAREVLKDKTLREIKSYHVQLSSTENVMLTKVSEKLGYSIHYLVQLIVDFVINNDLFSTISDSAVPNRKKITKIKNKWRNIIAHDLDYGKHNPALNGLVEMWFNNSVGVDFADKSKEEEPQNLVIEVELPDNISDNEAKEIIKKAALLADEEHRARGGNGLKIEKVLVKQPSLIPETI